MPKRRLNALTGLRFLAAMQVVIFHSRSIFARFLPFFRNMINNGDVAVSLFFVLSGFVLAYNYIQIDNGIGYMRTKSREFWLARFARIYPGYFLALLMFTPAVVLGRSLIARGEITSTLFSTIFLVQAWNGHMYWNQPGWSLSCEAFFYLMFPVLVIVISRSSAKGLVRWMAIAWAVDLAFPALYQTGLIHNLNFTLYGPLVRLPEFFLGACAGTAYLMRPKTVKGLTLIAGATIILCLGYSPYLPRFALHNGLLAPAFAALIWGLATEEGTLLARFLATPGLVLLGDASYSIYIMQGPFWIWLKGFAVVFFHFTSENGSTWFFLLYSVGLIVFSVLVYRWIETPARRKLRGQFVPRYDHANTPV